MERGEKHQRQIREEQSSGKWDFGDQPALFAVAHAIVTNDQDAIRAAAKALPDLQAPGRYGMTLLYFAVTESWQRPELVDSVKTLLSLGADPSYTNGHPNSFAMFHAVHASVDDADGVGGDGMTLGRMLTDRRAQFGRTHKRPPAEFTALWG